MEYQRTRISTTAEFEEILTEKQRKRIQDAAFCRRYEKGRSIPLTELMEQNGETVPYEAVDGLFAVDVADSNGKRLSVMLLEAGQLLSWMRSVAQCNAQYTMELRAVETSVIKLLPQETLRAVLRENAMAGKRLFREQGIAMEQLYDTIYEIAFLNLEERLCRRLLKYESMLQTDCLNLTHEELAQELGVSREAISRALSRLTKQGRVKMMRRRIMPTEQLKKSCEQERRQR